MDLVAAILACQTYLVLFIALHDWLPLGKFNNLAGIRTVDTVGKRVLTTILSTLPFAIGLVASVRHASTGFPMWLMVWLWISYLGGVYGMLRAWWIPYLLISDPTRAARYQTRFSGTHAFLPMRNGIRPDTLHVTFHAVLLTLVVLLGILSVARQP